MRADPPDTHAFRHLLKKHLQNGCPNRMGEQTSNIKTAYYLECNMPSLKVLPSTTTYSKHRQMPTLSPMHLCTYALKHLSTSKLPADKKKTTVKVHVSQKRQSQPLRHNPAVTPRAARQRLHTTCHRRQRSHHVSQKTTVHTTCHKRLRYTTCHKRRRYTPRVTKDDGTHVSQKTTVHNTRHKDNGTQHVSQRRRYMPRVDNGSHRVPRRRRYIPRVDNGSHHVPQSTEVVRLCHEGQ